MNLDHRIRTVLAQLEIRLHYGSITAYNSSGSGGKAEGGNRPPGDSNPPHVRYRAEYIECEDDHCRIGVCEAAEQALKALTSFKAGDVKEETLDELYARLTLEKYEGESANDVAHWERSSPSIVRKARLAQGREATFGLLKVTKRVANVEERVQNLASRHCSVRQIADQVGVSKSTVQRILKDAA